LILEETLGRVPWPLDGFLRAEVPLVTDLNGTSTWDGGGLGRCNTDCICWGVQGYTTRSIRQIDDLDLYSASYYSEIL